jgi:hypothetical protein
MLLPALSESRTAARRVICVNNLHQWGRAFSSYTNDYDSWLPPRNPGYYYANIMDKILRTEMTTYGSTIKIGFCPLDPVPDQLNACLWTLNNRSGGAYCAMTYTYLPYAHEGNNNPILAKRMNGDEDSKGNESFLLADTDRIAGTTVPLSMNHPDPNGIPNLLTSAVCPGLVYNNIMSRGVNILYQDGRVTWLWWQNLDKTIRYRYGDNSHYWE